MLGAFGPFGGLGGLMHFDIAHSLAKVRLMMAESSHFDIAHGLAMARLMLAESSHFDRAHCRPVPGHGRQIDGRVFALQDGRSLSCRTCRPGEASVIFCPPGL